MSVDNLYLTKYARECNIAPCADKPTGYFYFLGFPKAYFRIEVEEINFVAKPKDIKIQILEIGLRQLSKNIELSTKRCFV